MLTLKNIAGACLVATLGLTGCQGPNAMGNGNLHNDRVATTMPPLLPEIRDVDLANYNWQLFNALDKQHQPLATLKDIKDDITLNFNNGRVNFTVGCNSMDASYRLNNDAIQVGDIRSTMMMCHDKNIAEGILAETMKGTSRIEYHVGGSPLLMQHANNGNLLVWQGTLTPEAQYNQQGETVFWEVNHSQVACQDDPRASCLQVRPVQYNAQGLKTSVGNWQQFSGDIQGYTHQSDVDEIIRLSRYETGDNNPNAPRYAYVYDTTVESSLVN